MIVLSLFDGISCGRVALERAGIPVTKYYASEIDQHAINIAMKNYPDTIQLGNINNFGVAGKWWDQKQRFLFEKPDLIIGGSPCQGFSFAGKQLAFDDPRSALFWKYVEIVKYYRPKYFLLENVRMKKEHLQVITDALGVEPICINSALVSAQNRVRYYWTNIPNVTQPDDRGTVLKDIIEQGVVDQDKSYCIDANYWKGGNLKSYFEKHRRQLVFNLNDNKRVKAITENERGYRPHRGDTKSTGISELGRILKPNSKSDSLTTSHMPKLALNNSIKDLKYRKLTPIECERLQTLPDNYTEGVSNTQRYKMLGNGWTVDVLAHIFRGLKNET